MISNLLKQFKAKHIEEEGNDTTTFSIKEINCCVQNEGENYLQWWIVNIDGVELPTTYWDNYLECGDIDDFEDFLDSVNRGEFNHIKSLYNSLVKLQEKFGEDYDKMFPFAMNS